MGRKKNVEDQVSDLIETMVKQIALLHLPTIDEIGKDLESEDIEAIADLASVPIEEIVLGVLNAHAIGYLGSIDDKDQGSGRRKVV